MVYIAAHWQNIVLILIAVSTAIKEVCSVLGDNGPIGILDAVITLLGSLKEPPDAAEISPAPTGAVIPPKV